MIRCPFSCGWAIDEAEYGASEAAVALAAHISAHNQEEDAVQTGPVKECKVEGCHEPSVDRVGMYGRLCAIHKAEKVAAGKAQRARGGATADVPPSTNGSLVALAQAADDAKHEYERALDALRQAVAAA